MKAIILARVSSKEQEDGQSIPAQIRRLTEYALKRNFTIDSTFQVTESSTKESRKQFDQIVQYIKKSKGSFALIVDTVDRLQRSFRETPLLDELRKLGKIELHFLREGLIITQLSNSAQLLQWDVGVLFASSYVRQLSDNVKRSQEQCIKNGQWVFSKPPYGYKNVTLPSGKKDVQVDQEQAVHVAKIFAAYATGNYSFETLAIKMRSEGFTLSSRGKLITSRTIELIVKNPFYTGKMAIKKGLYPHKYPTLVSAELFDKVQAVINNHYKGPVQFAGKPILFRGLIRCKNCNSAITGDVKKQKYVYYSCHNAKKICQKKWVKEEQLLEAILPYFDHIQLTDQQIQEILDYIKNAEDEETESTKKARESAHSKLLHTKERISKLIDMHIDGKIDAQTYHYKLEEYKKEQQQLELDIKSYDKNDATELITAQAVLELAQQSGKIFKSSNMEEKQHILRFMFSNLELNSGNLDLELRYPFNVMATVQDQTQWRQTLVSLRTFRWSSLGISMLLSMPKKTLL